MQCGDRGDDVERLLAERMTHEIAEDVLDRASLDLRAGRLDTRGVGVDTHHRRDQAGQLAREEAFAASDVECGAGVGRYGPQQQGVVVDVVIPAPVPLRRSIGHGTHRVTAKSVSAVRGTRRRYGAAMVEPDVQALIGLPFDHSDEVIRTAVEQASVPALLMSMVHMTGDLGLLDELPGPYLLFAMDLQGGMSVTMEVGLDGLIRSLANYSKDAAFNNALNSAVTLKANSGADLISLFGQEYKKVSNGAKLAPLFVTRSDTKIKFESSDDKNKEIGQGILLKESLLSHLLNKMDAADSLMHDSELSDFIKKSTEEKLKITRSKVKDQLIVGIFANATSEEIKI